MSNKAMTVWHWTHYTNITGLQDKVAPVYIYLTPPLQVGWDTGLIFQWSTAGLNSVSLFLDWFGFFV